MGVFLERLFFGALGYAFLLWIVHLLTRYFTGAGLVDWLFPKK